jgi:hypothetical protein
MWIGHDEEETPFFAVMKDICVVERNLTGIWFITNALHTTSFNKHAYEVNSIDKLIWSKLVDLHLRT